MWYVELVKELVWPAVVIYIFSALRPEIRGVLPAAFNRIRELELPGGIKAKMDVAEQQQASKENPIEEKLNAKQTLPIPSLAVSQIEARLRSELEVIEEGQRQTILLRALAQSRLEAGHEFTYNRIFGSQIAGLKRLNEAGRVTVNDAHEFFKRYAEQFHEFYRAFGFEDWLGFLLNTGLVVRNDDVLEITEFGREFLVYLTTRRLSEAKPW